MAQPAQTYREAIVEEMVRRCHEIRDTATNKRTLVERGWDGVDVDVLPKIVVFEDTEVVEEIKRGLYQKKLPLQIEYFRSVNKPEQIYIQGNRMLADLTQAIELDELFFVNAMSPIMSTEQQGRGLVREYRQTRNDIIELTGNRALVILWYELTYFECRPGVINPPNID